MHPSIQQVVERPTTAHGNPGATPRNPAQALGAHSPADALLLANCSSHEGCEGVAPHGDYGLLESFARGRALIKTSDAWTRTTSIYICMLLAVSDGVEVGSTVKQLLSTQSIRLSAASTAHKLILITEHVPAPELVVAAKSMIRVMERELSYTAHRPHSHQMYILVGATVQALLPQLVPTDNVQLVGARLLQLNDVYPAPDFYTHPELYSACADVFATSFKGQQRLLPTCSDPGCQTLEGAMDAEWRTPHVCGGCRRAKYCSVSCAKADWATWHHRSVCDKGACALPVEFPAVATAKEELDAAREAYAHALHGHQTAAAATALETLAESEAAYLGSVARKSLFAANAVTVAKASAIAGLN